MTSPTISFSRSGRSGLHGKNDQRMSADVPQALLDDLDEAVARQREHVQTATRSEVLRSIVDEDLNGRIGECAALRSGFGGGSEMNRHDYESLTVPLHDDPRPHHDPLELQPLDQALRYRQAPRIPRDTEPCQLWAFALIVAGCIGCLAMVAGWLIYGAGEGIGEMVRYADAFYVAMVRWIGGVL